MSTPNDVEVIVGVDCGNAPKKAQVRDWVISLARGQVDEVCDALSDGVTWEVAKADTTAGIERVRALVEDLASRDVSLVEIRHLLSHGKQVAAEGMLTVGGSEERFVHMITYSGFGKSAKISEVLTYRA